MPKPPVPSRSCRPDESWVAGGEGKESEMERSTPPMEVVPISGTALINLALGFRLQNKHQCVVQGFAFLYNYLSICNNKQENCETLTRNSLIKKILFQKFAGDHRWRKCLSWLSSAGCSDINYRV